VRVVVIYESLRGHTKEAAERIGGAARASGATVAVRPITAYDFKEIADADVVFLGSWTDGFILFGQRPGRAGRIWKLPVLDRKPVALFCTYAVNPRTTLKKFAAIAEAKGAVVVGEHAFKRDKLTEGVDEFVGDVLARVGAPA
jgi:hypothetical protein